MGKHDFVFHKCQKWSHSKMSKKKFLLHNAKPQIYLTDNVRQMVDRAVNCRVI